ncbi:choline dehydrogenase [Microbacterium endophyticum]|uniref:Choline dehydrogenase n=1 Tax=Microbacterium endophyticum TaxID=1526412 RepID=A0A7W4YMC4_9MICO|nr:FAD-dependent oxidoreductase [Microbacterium endophyticum]MBB2975354.1 choline dehydrogenase [Microbacterium endophyticum]NIK35627.1 choline dehydrogenase [Microbacterium endophyticum]
MTDTLPREAEYVVVGGGTAGNVVAARLAEAGLDVLVLEAGPDFGAEGSEAWPADLIDATRLGRSHDWGYDSGSTYPWPVRFERARAIGGSSDFNGCTQTWGHRRDYDSWAERGLAGWSADELSPLFDEGTRRMRVRQYRPDELTPWQNAWYEAAPFVGIPQVPDLNNLDEAVGFAPEAVNIQDGVRVNSAFAYLDPARGLHNLTVVGDALVDRVMIDNGRATGVVVRHHGAVHTVYAHTVILAGGTYNSPTILLRSGIGPYSQLAPLDIDVVEHLPGVGENLHDQPFLLMSWEGSDEMTRAMAAARAAGWAPDEQAMGKAASSFEHEAFDLHFLPYSPTHRGDAKRWSIGTSALQPRSRGFVRVQSADPEAKPVIDHRFLSDSEGVDVAMLVEGAEILRELAASPALAPLVGPEIHPGPESFSREALVAHIYRHPDNYWHPVGTCAMGVASDRSAVVDARARVHGIEGLRVADCSIMPQIPRATTAMPAIVVGERVAGFLLEEAMSR